MGWTKKNSIESKNTLVKAFMISASATLWRIYVGWLTFSLLNMITFGGFKSRKLMDSRVEILNRTRPLTPPRGLPHRNKCIIPFESNYEVRQLIKGSRLLDLSHSLERFMAGPPWREKTEEWEKRRNGWMAETRVPLLWSSWPWVTEKKLTCHLQSVLPSIFLSNTCTCWCLQLLSELPAALAPNTSFVALRWHLYGASALGGTSHIFIVCVSWQRGTKSHLWGKRVCEAAMILCLRLEVRTSAGGGQAREKKSSISGGH